MHCSLVHYNYNALCGVVHEIYSTARSFDLRCESVTYTAASAIRKIKYEAKMANIARGEAECYIS